MGPGWWQHGVVIYHSPVELTGAHWSNQVPVIRE